MKLLNKTLLLGFPRQFIFMYCCETCVNIKRVCFGDYVNTSRACSISYYVSYEVLTISISVGRPYDMCHYALVINFHDANYTMYYI